MNKSQLVERIALKANMTKSQSEAVLDVLLETITGAVSEGEDVKLVGFGVFDTYTRAPRTARNPKTGDKISVPSMKVPRFRPGKEFRENVK